MEKNGDGVIERTPERELLPMADALNIGVTAWSPLGGGVLAGKYNKSNREEQQQTHQQNTSSSSSTTVVAQSKRVCKEFLTIGIC